MTGLLSKEEWRKKRQKRRYIMRVLIICVSMAFIVLAILFRKEIYQFGMGSRQNETEKLSVSLQNGKDVVIDYLTPNQYSRPQTELKKVKGIVVHYTANPGTTADNNRNYFEGLGVKGTTYASSHYIIGLEGEIVQCLPLNEISYASNDRNADTISIECCHSDLTGEFNPDTYESLVSLTAALCVEFNLEAEDVIRHYDVTGKLCPLYYVEHEDAWNNYKLEVNSAIKELKTKT
ncbi:MAG: peptidoglycan recognition family protein [Mobilitalea sp.]